MNNQNSAEYQNLINKFLERFELCFSNTNIKISDIRKMFLQNLKCVKKHEGVEWIRKPIIGRIAGVYDCWSKTLEYVDGCDSTEFHELFHALSRSIIMKRQPFLKFLLAIFFGQKQFDIRPFNEGMTNYLAIRMAGEGTAYIQETTIINKLAKIYGDKIILEYYLGFNEYLVDALNNDIPDGFRKVVSLCRKASTNKLHPIPFEATKYYKRNGEIVQDDLMFKLFSKRKLVEVETIEDFKHNVRALFDFYKSDLHKICADIAKSKARIEDSHSEKEKSHIQQIIKQYASLFANFNNILVSQ